MTILTDELHIHLYGCLSAADVWLLGRDRYERQADRLRWYADSYEQAFGRRPDPAAYWRRDDGLERLEGDFIFFRHGSFSQFQACFNLMIALLPILPDGPTVLRHVLAKERQRGVRYGEYRSFIPPQLDRTQIATYVGEAATIVREIADASGPSFLPRLAFSLSRDPGLASAQAATLQELLAAQPQLAEVITGVDFCGAEEGHPPAPLAPVFSQILAANQASPATALSILYHVGEAFDAMSVMSAMRWVWQAHALGAHRLGHAIALGMNLDALAHQSSVREQIGERLAHLRWLQEHQGWLGERGHRVDSTACQRELSALAEQSPEAWMTITYDDGVLAEARSLQGALRTDLADKGAIVECCPSSNLRIGRIEQPEHHPLPTFLTAGLTTVVSTDDPGIFAVDLASEEELCRRSFGLDDHALSKLQATNVAVRSEALVRS